MTHSIELPEDENIQGLKQFWSLIVRANCQPSNPHHEVVKHSLSKFLQLAKAKLSETLATSVSNSRFFTNLSIPFKNISEKERSIEDGQADGILHNIHFIHFFHLTEEK